MFFLEDGKVAQRSFFFKFIHFIYLFLSALGLRCYRRASHCGSAQAQLLHGMWDLPGPGLEPMSPALAGGFLTTVPPGKSSTEVLNQAAAAAAAATVTK